MENVLFSSIFFTKSDQANISQKELTWFKELAKDAFLMTDDHINKRLQVGTLQEILGE